MATIMIDQYGEYVWHVEDATLKKVIEYVMRRVDSRSPFHDLLFASRNFGNLAFHQLGNEQKELFQTHVKSFQQEANLSEDESKAAQKLIDMLEFSKGFDEKEVVGG